MNKTKGFLIIGIVLSALWLLNSFFDDTGVRGFDMNDFVILGLLPVVIFWGLVLTVPGSGNKDDKTEDDEQDI